MKKQPQTPVEMLVGRYTWTESGATLTPEEATREGLGRGPAADPHGWFWIAATPTSAARIREHGHKAVGTLVTTWIPPQEPGGVLKPGVTEPDGNLRTQTTPEGITTVVQYAAGARG